MNRRRFITVSSTAVAIGGTGCLGFFEDDDTDSPESAGTALIEAIAEGDSDRVENLLHPESPLDANEITLDGSTSVSSSTIDGEVEVEEFTVDDMDTDGYNIWVDEETMSQLVETEEVTLVRVTAEAEGGEEFDFLVLTATDESDWYALDYWANF